MLGLMPDMRPLGSSDSKKSKQLALREAIESAWLKYVQSGLEPVGIPKEISCSWRRARDSRIDPAAPRPNGIEPWEALEQRRQRDEVFRLAIPILRDFADRLSLADHALAFFDGEGWMLSIDGDRKVIERLGEISFQPGANWAEKSAGTNGPGTALAEGRPIEIFASEHYMAVCQPWSCAAVPILLNGSSVPAGVIDLTGPWEVRRRQALLVVKAIARAIQERVHAARSVRDEVVRHAFRMARQSGEALVAVDSRGRVIAVNDAASRRRIVEGGALPPTVEQAIVRAFSLPGADGELSIELPQGSLVASAVHHEETAVGAILRIRTHGEPARPARRAGRASSRYDFSQILGHSQALERALELAESAARNELPVVLSGESGTGKELFAHSIHAASLRNAGPFIAVNCGSIPEPMVESELFGYEAGAFTGARREGSPGRCEDASGGTLFLDEVCELPPQAQTALLRVLQEKEVVRLGGSTPRAVDIRIVAATNRPLEEEVRARRFRSDLYYRLNVLSIQVPALRERGDDVELLAQAFLQEARVELGREELTLGDDAIEALRGHRWPGNVRELKNVIQRASATAPGALIAARDLAIEAVVLEAPEKASKAPERPVREAVHTLEREALVEAVVACGWNLARAAQQLGISRMTLYRWMHKHGIARPSSQG